MPLLDPYHQSKKPSARNPRNAAQASNDTLSPGVAKIVCRQIRERLKSPGAVMRAARATGFAHTYLSQIKTARRVPLQRHVYITLYTQAFHMTYEQTNQLIAKAQLEDMGFTNPDLSLRLAEFNLLSKDLTSEQVQGLIDYLEGWLVRRRRDARRQEQKEIQNEEDQSSGD